MQLGQPETLAILDDHEAGVRHIHAYLDHGGGHQHGNLAALERIHHRLLFLRLHPAMDHGYGKIRQPRDKLRMRHLGGLCIELLGFLDQRAHPVHLTPFHARGMDAFHHVVTALVGDGNGLHRRTPRRQLVDGRDIEISIRAHRQRTRDRRSREHKLVRNEFTFRALVTQGESLVHAETMLFVDDDQPQLCKRHAFLHERMRADDDVGAAIGHPRQRTLARLALHLAREPLDIQAQRFKPRTEIAQVLFGQQFGRRHQRHLVTAFHGGNSRECRHHRLAAAHIALHEPQHGMRTGEITCHFTADARLGFRQREGQRCQQAIAQGTCAFERRRFTLLHRCPHAPQREMLREQFLERQAFLRRMHAELQLAQIHIRRRPMHVQQGITKRSHAERATDIVGNQFEPVILRQVCQRLGNHTAKTTWPQPFRGGIDRRQPLIHHHRLTGLDTLVLWMHHLQALRPLTHFAEAEHARAFRQLIDLALAEMEETQQQCTAGFVGNDHLQLWPEAEAPLDEIDRALDLRMITRPQIGKGHDPRAVFVAQRQVKPEILHLAQTELAQRLGERRPDAAECRQRRAARVRRRCGGSRPHAGSHGDGESLTAGRGSRRLRPGRPWAGPRPRWSNAPDTAAGSIRPSRRSRRRSCPGR